MIDRRARRESNAGNGIGRAIAHAIPGGLRFGRAALWRLRLTPTKKWILYWRGPPRALDRI